MSLNRRNQTISRQLTLEQIIQKSAIRKNIDTININQTLNTHRSNQLFTSNNQRLPIPNHKNTQINHFVSTQNFNYKHYFDNHQQLSLTPNKNSTTRILTFKETYIYNLQSHHDQNKNTLNQSEKLKQFKSSSQLPLYLEKRKDSSKSKTKSNKHPDYLCVKGSSGNPLHFQTQNHLLINQQSPQFQITNYQTLNDFPSQTNKSQKSIELRVTPLQNEDMKKHDSFVMSKNRTVNNFRQKPTKLPGSKNPSKNNIKNQFILPDQFISKAISGRAVKTQQKKREKVQIDIPHQQPNNHEKIKNLQFFSKSSNKQSPTKQSITINHTILRSEDILKEARQQHPKSKLNKNNSPSKQGSENSLRQTKIKGFRGTKIMSISEGERIKSRYFIPDFLKPSLDPIMFEKKLVDVIKARGSQNPVNEGVISLQNSKQQNDNKKQIEDQQVNKKLQQLFLRLKTTNQEIPYSKEHNEQQDPSLVENSEPENTNYKQTKQKKIQLRQDAKMRDKTDLFGDHQICGWEDNHNQEKPLKFKNKKRAQKFVMNELLDL